MLKYTIRMRVNFAFCLGGAFSNYRRKVGDDIVSEVAAFYKPVHRMHSHPSPLHPPPLAKGRGAEKNTALGARFQKLREELYYQGAESSKGQGELKSQRGLDSRGLPCFSANVLFLWQHCY